MDEVTKAPKWEHKELKAIGVSIFFLILGFIVLWLTETIMGDKGDAAYVSLLFIPVLVYVIISGRLKELKGPGGLEARFAEAATQSIKTVYESETVEPSVEEMQILAKEGLKALQKKEPDFDESKPLIMTIVLGKGAYYDWQAIKQYMNFLSQYRNFKFVIFLNDKERFVAYMPSWAFKGIIGLRELADEFIDVINDGRLRDLYRYPGVERETISTKSSNEEALRLMTAKNLEALVVIDEDRKLKGVVEREQVIGRMMLAIVK